MLGGAVGAPHIAGVGCLGSACCDLMFLSSISTNKLALFRWERSDAIESITSGGHSSWGDSEFLLGAVGA